MDEACLVNFREYLPRTWYNLYQGCLQAGFDKQQSFALLQTWIGASATHKFIPPTCDGPQSDKPD